MANGNFGGGNGTVENPWLVEDLADLKAVGTTGYYLQTANITVTGTGNPIVTSSLSRAFRGNYDGGNNTIFINSSSSYTLFHETRSNSQISNIKIKTANISVSGNGSDMNVAFLCGRSNSSISNVHIEGNLSVTSAGSSKIGGMVARSDSGGVLNCSFTGNISVLGADNNGCLGGLISKVVHTSISNCFFNGTISSSGYVGGLLGEADYSPITNCYSSGKVVAGGTVAGGLVATSYSEITKCYSSCNIVSTSIVTDYIAGISGMASLPVKDCFYLGDYIQRAPGNQSTDFADIVAYDASYVQNCFSLNTLEFREG